MASSDPTPSETQPGVEDPVTELNLVETELSDLRRRIRDLRSELADEGPGDAADRAAVITQAEELDAFAAVLERRREALVEQLRRSQ